MIKKLLFGVGLSGVLGLSAEAGVVEALAAGARPLRTEADLAPLVAAMGEARVVLLGEASHGTEEFYEWRSKLTRRLVAEHGFRVVAVEGDWAPLYRLNRYVKGGEGETAAAVLAGLTRWPEWLWANQETAELAEWMREWNAGRPEGEQVGFYGMDAYAPWEAAEMVLGFLETSWPERAGAARAAYAPLLGGRVASRAFIHGSILMSEAEREGVRAVAAGLRERGAAEEGTGGWFAAWQAAKVVVGAKTHFRASTGGGPESWNARARHMHETVVRLMAARGEGAKAVVWAHNTHVGDARATPMGAAGMVNLGEDARRHFGAEEVFGLGFATFAGEVVAARAWEGRREVMTIPEAGVGTLEAKLAGLGRGDVWLDLRGAGMASDLSRPVPHRAIGVVYLPELDAQRNFVPSVLPARYDALVFIERTTALRLLDAEE